MYQAEQDGTHHELGTSGFLYRSNKLMYDHETKSLWSTIQGKPVVGSLVGKGIELEQLHTVTTDWKTWLSQHPDTKVLSLKTGFRRDYGEGRAYAEYFSHDRLMFQVPVKTKPVLKNKAEVFAMRDDKMQLAISAEFLSKNPVYQGKLSDQEFVIFTDEAGGNRAYDSTGLEFESWDGKSIATQSDGTQWELSELGLTNETGKKLERLPAHRAFWFGWLAQYPDTELVN